MRGTPVLAARDLELLAREQRVDALVLSLKIDFCNFAQKWTDLFAQRLTDDFAPKFMYLFAPKLTDLFALKLTGVDLDQGSWMLTGAPGCQLFKSAANPTEAPRQSDGGGRSLQKRLERR